MSRRSQSIATATLALLIHAGKFDTFLRSEWQAGDDTICHVLGLEIGDEITRLADHRGFPASDRGQAQRIADKVAACPGMSADKHIVENGKMLKERDVLECAPDPKLGDAMRRTVEDRAAFKEDIAARRRVEPAQAIEQGGLTGAVRPDESENLPPLDLK